MRPILRIILLLSIAYDIIFMITGGFFGTVTSMLSFGIGLILITITAIILATTERKSDHF